MGIYEPTSAHPDRAKDCVVLVTCGGDPALRREVGEAENRQREREDIYSLSFNRAELLCPEASVFMLKGNTKALAVINIRPCSWKYS